MSGKAVKEPVLVHATAVLVPDEQARRLHGGHEGAHEGRVAPGTLRKPRQDLLGHMGKVVPPLQKYLHALGAQGLDGPMLKAFWHPRRRETRAEGAHQAPGGLLRVLQQKGQEFQGEWVCMVEVVAEEQAGA